MRLQQGEPGGAHRDGVAVLGVGGAFTDLLGTSCGDSALSDSETREGPRWLSPGVPCGAVCSVPILYCDQMPQA